MGEKKRKQEAVKRFSPTARFIYEMADPRNDMRTPKCACLGCGKLLDAATALEKGKRPGMKGCTSFSICGSCGHLQAFDEDLKFRPLTDEEIIEVAGDLDLVTANTVRGPVRDLWERGDPEGAWRFVRDRIRDEIGRARTR